MHQHAAHWEVLGARLGLKDYNIANISRDYPNWAVDACREMLMMWLQVTCSPTWGQLDDAINSMKNISTSDPQSKFITAIAVLL